MSEKREKEDLIQLALFQLQMELVKAMSKHRAMASLHDGKAVIEEELDELWDEIKTQVPDRHKLYKEALQVAATGLRFVIDLCPEVLKQHAPLPVYKCGCSLDCGAFCLLHGPVEGERLKGAKSGWLKLDCG